MNSHIEQIVINRIERIYMLRSLGARTLVASAIFALALYLIGRGVWVARVWENMPSPTDVIALIAFFKSAFLSTEAVIQVLLILVLLTGMRIAYGATQLASLMLLQRGGRMIRG